VGISHQLAYTLQFLQQACDISRLSDPLVVQDRSIFDTHQVVFDSSGCSMARSRLLSSCCWTGPFAVESL